MIVHTTLSFFLMHMTPFMHVLWCTITFLVYHQIFGVQITLVIKKNNNNTEGSNIKINNHHNSKNDSTKNSSLFNVLVTC